MFAVEPLKKDESEDFRGNINYADHLVITTAVFATLLGKGQKDCITPVLKECFRIPNIHNDPM